MRLVTRVLAAAVMAAVSLVGLAMPAGAQPGSFVIDLEGVATGAVGSVLQVASETVDPQFVGATCTVSGATENNSSVHPDNDLILTSGTTTAEVGDIEDIPGQVVTGSGPMTLGETIDVSLRFGPDGLTSAGIRLTFTCDAAAPAPGVETGAGGTAATFTSTGSALPLAPMVAVSAVAAMGSALFVFRRRAATA